MPRGVIWEVCKFQSYDFRNLYTFTCKFLKTKGMKSIFADMKSDQSIIIDKRIEEVQSVT